MSGGERAVAVGPLGVPVILSPHVIDGRVIYSDGLVVVGVRPLTEVEEAGREARRAVRRGYAEVLGWLGEPVDVEPGSAEVLAALGAGVEVGAADD